MNNVIKIIHNEEYPNDIKVITYGLTTIRVTVFAKTSLDDFEKIDNSNGGALYFLYNEPHNGTPSLYIGETEKIYERLKQHDRSKMFWTHTIVFQEMSGKLNKAHYKYLENKSWTLADFANRAYIVNRVVPTKSMLSEEDRIIADVFFNAIKNILIVLNYKFLEQPVVGAFEEDSDLFYLTERGANVKLRIFTSSDMLMIKGSICRYECDNRVVEKDRFKKMKELKDYLIKEKKARIIEDTNLIELTDDVKFDSEHEAAAFALMDNIDTSYMWKDLNGYGLEQCANYKIRK